MQLLNLLGLSGLFNQKRDCAHDSRLIELQHEIDMLYDRIDRCEDELEYLEAPDYSLLYSGINSTCANPE